VHHSPSYTMKADFINPFLQSTLSALVDLASINDVSATKPCLKSATQAAGVLTSIIDMNGTPVYGSYAVTFSQTVLDEICQRLFAEELKKGAHPLVLATDFIGEFANIVCGRAKDVLSRRGFCFGLAMPRVITGTAHRIEHAIQGPVIQVPFNCQWGDFYVETSFCHADHYYAPAYSMRGNVGDQNRAVA